MIELLPRIYEEALGSINSMGINRVGSPWSGRPRGGREGVCCGEDAMEMLGLGLGVGVEIRWA